jgi:hypothetical protein
MTTKSASDPLMKHCRSLPAVTEDIKREMFAGFQLPAATRRRLGLV